MALDLSQQGTAVKLHRATAKLAVTLLVANAGISSHSHQHLDLSARTIEQMAAVNMVSTASLCQLYAGSLPPGSTILLTSSVTAYAPLPGAGMYAASRAFVHSMAGALHEELAARSIRVICLLPGATETGFAKASKMESALAFTGPFFHTLGVVLPPERVARIAVNAVLSTRTSGDVIPNIFNRAYALAARAILPRGLAASFAKQFFGEVSPLTSLATLIPVVPVLLSGVAAVLLALPVVVVQDLLEMAPAWLSYWLLFLAALLVFEWLTRPC